MCTATLADYQHLARTQAEKKKDQAPTDNQPRLVLQLGHSNEGVTSAVLSADGRFVLTGSYDESACLWDARTGRELQRLTGHKEVINDVALSADSRFALTAGGSSKDSQDNSVRLWDLQTGRELRRFEGHASGVLAVAFSADGKLVLTGGYDRTAQLWDANTGERLRVFEGYRSWVTAVAFIPKSQTVAIGTSLNSASLADAVTGDQVQSFRADPPGSGVKALAVSPNGQVLASAGAADRVTRLWDIASGKEIRRLAGHTGLVNAVAFSKDGKFLLTGSGKYGENEDYTARLWEVATGTEVRRFQGHTDELETVSFSADSLSAVTGSLDSTVRIWSLVSGQEMRRFEGYAKPVEAMSLSPDCRYVLTGSSDNKARLWDTVSGSVVLTFDSQTPGTVTGLAFSPDGRFALTGSSDGSARLWNVETAQEKSHITGSVLKNAGRFTGHVMSINAIAFSPNGTLVAAGSGDQTVYVWDLSRNKVVRQLGEIYFLPDEPLPAPPSAITSVAFSPDGRQLLVAQAFDPEVQLWNVLSGKQERKFKVNGLGNVGIISKVAFSPNGAYVLAGASDGTVRVLNAVTGKQISAFANDSDRVLTMAFSPDGQSVLTGNGDGIVRLWDLEKGSEVKRFVGSGVVVSVAFARNGRYIVTGSLDSTTRFWDLSSGRELCRIVSLRDDIWVVVDPAGRFDTNNLEEIKGLHWILPDAAFTAQPLELFMRDYYEPQLLPRLLKCNEQNNCEREFQPVRDLSKLNRVHSEVKINAVSVPDADGYVNVSVEVSKGEQKYLVEGQEIIRTSGVYDLRLFRDGQMVASWPGDGSEKLLQQAVQRSEAEKELTGEAKLERELWDWRQATEIKGDKEIGIDRETRKMMLPAIRIRLPRGKDASLVEFTAYAFNEDRVKSETAKWTWPEEQKARLPKAQTVRRRAYLVSIGVDASQEEKWELKYAANDARLMNETVAKELERIGEYEPVSILLVADDELREGKNVPVRDATKAKVRAVIDLLAGRAVEETLKRTVPGYEKLTKATPDDLVLLSFSSHGYADLQGDFYLLPYDVRSVAGAGKQLPDLRSCISSEELSLWLRDVDAREMVMIVDACHAAAAVQGSGFKPGPMGSRGLGQLSYDKGMRILTATRAADAAVEVGGAIRQGLLSYALVKEGIEQRKADFKPVDREVTLKEWFQYGVSEVPEIHRRLVNGELKGIGRDVLQDEERRVVRYQQQPALFDFSRKRADVRLMSFQH